MVTKENKMTVNELIEQLKNYPGDMRVLTLGYEAGLDDISVDSDSVVFDTNTTDTWYNGKHEYASFMDSLPNSDSQWKSNGLQSGKCVIIRRGK
jgi:hypothetical protein